MAMPIRLSGGGTAAVLVGYVCAGGACCHRAGGACGNRVRVDQPVHGAGVVAQILLATWGT